MKCLRQFGKKELAMPENSVKSSIESAHILLRERTHAAHARLNRHRLLAGLTRPNYPRQNYWKVIAAYAQLYEFLEGLILSHLHLLAGGFNYIPRQKLGWLRQDLAVADNDPATMVAITTAPRIAPIVIEDSADLVGVLYPIEGSTLGGQVISGHIESRLGLSPTRGGRFFNGYGAQTEHYWGEFLTFAEITCPDQHRRDKAALSALSVFAAVESILDEYAGDGTQVAEGLPL